MCIRDRIDDEMGLLLRRQNYDLVNGFCRYAVNEASMIFPVDMDSSCLLYTSDPDYIDQLADRIEVENLPDNEHTDSHGVLRRAVYHDSVIYRHYLGGECRDCRAFGGWLGVAGLSLSLIHI